MGEPPGPSPFTQALVDGLRTGEADRNEDGQVSIERAVRFPRGPGPGDVPVADADEVGRESDGRLGDRAQHRGSRASSSFPSACSCLLKSGEPIDRLEAIIDLERIRSSPDKRTAQAATAAIQTLAADDSRRVAQRAVQALGDESAAPGGNRSSASRGSRVPRRFNRHPSRAEARASCRVPATSSRPRVALGAVAVRLGHRSSRGPWAARIADRRRTDCLSRAWRHSSASPIRAGTERRVALWWVGGTALGRRTADRGVPPAASRRRRVPYVDGPCVELVGRSRRWSGSPSVSLLWSWTQQQVALLQLLSRLDSPDRAGGIARRLRHRRGDRRAGSVRTLHLGRLPGSCRTQRSARAVPDLTRRANLGLAAQPRGSRERSEMGAPMSSQKVGTSLEGMRLHAHAQSRNPRPRRRR